MKHKIISSLLAISCILPNTVMAVENIEQNEIETTESEEVEILEPEYEILGGSVTLNFDVAGGVEVDSMSLPVASTPRDYELPVPKKAGHVFDGWYTKDGSLIEGKNVFEAFEIVKNGQSATVKAKWIKQEPVNSTSSISIEEIPDSEEYYELVTKYEDFADGSRIVYNTKTKKIEDYTIDEFTTITYINTDGSQSQEGIGTYYGYSDYQRDHAQNIFSVTAVDVNNNPVQGIQIQFKTDEEEITLTTDENGHIEHKFNRLLKYESELVSIPEGYILKYMPEKLGLGMMYSVNYTEKYVFDTEVPVETEETTSSEEVTGNEETTTESEVTDEVNEETMQEATEEKKTESPVQVNSGKKKTKTENKTEETITETRTEIVSTGSEVPVEIAGVIVADRNIEPDHSPSMSIDTDVDIVLYNVPEVVDTESEDSNVSVIETGTPQTGDETSASWFALFALSPIGMYFASRKKKND